MGEPTLAYTVHHKGRKFRAGMTATEIGPAAAKIGKHAWVDEIAPTADAVRTDGDPGGAPAARPPVPTPSALGVPPVPAEPVDVSGAAAEGGAEEESTPSRRAGGGRRGGQG
jgi:hypothetical protein